MQTALDSGHRGLSAFHPIRGLAEQTISLRDPLVIATQGFLVFRLRILSNSAAFRMAARSASSPFTLRYHAQLQADASPYVCV